MTAFAEQARSIFLAAIDRAPGEWPAFLDEACAGNADLRANVEQLLRAHEAMGSIHGGGQRSPVTIDRPTGVERPGTVIGPYKLIEQIGEGGMGVVYMAQQTEPVKRLVALKLIKAGMDSAQVIARFEAERQALAVMDHANIARVLDGGTTDAGRPYFVMDLVKGMPITRYCDEHHLTPRQRLELFIPVCQAVQHAHQKGIIHRDLKPSNVLVALYDGKPVPKVIDFGVAKATGQSLTDKTLVTGFGNIVGTLEYMSPEQAEVNQLDIDTRSDIYSLGVLLYELLAGSPPFSRKELEKAGMLEMLRVIREQEPSKPSTKLSSSEALPTLSVNRGTEPAKLTRLVRGELDWIVMKALEKDRNRRYETASGFAKDVERYLNDEPVQACPPSAGYRLRKFVRRNKRSLATVFLLGVMLLSVVGVLGWAVRDRIAREQEAARERETRHAVIKERVELALEEARKRQQEGRWKEALDAAKRAEALAATGESEEETHHRAREVLGDMQMLANLENVRVRSTQNEEGFNLKEEDSGNARAFREYGIDIDALDRDEAATRIRARTIRYELAVFLDSWSYVRRRLKQKGEKARGKDWKELLEIARAGDPDPWRDQFRKAVLNDDRKTLVELAASAPISSLPAETVDRLGNALMTTGAVQEAAAFLKEGQRHHPQDYWINENLAICLCDLNPPQLDGAVRYFSVAVALRPESVKSRTNLGQVLARLEKSDESIAWRNTAIELNPKDATAHYNFGKALQDQNRLDEAIAAYSKAIEIDPKLDRIHITRGEALCRRGRFREALADYQLATELAPDDLKAWYEAAALYLYLGDVERYRRACREMLDRFEQRTAENASIPEQTAKTCALAPDAVPNFARVERLAQRAVTGTEKHGWYRNFVLAKGLTDYRGGHHEQALESLERFAPKPGGNVWDATAFAALSMAHYRLGHAEQARTALRSARALLAKKKPDAQLFDWLHCEILYREAEGLMGSVTPQELAGEAPVDKNKAPSPKK